MYNTETIQDEITMWMTDFVEKSHPSLGNWPPCPYARQARMTDKIKVLWSNKADIQNLLSDESTSKITSNALSKEEAQTKIKKFIA